MTRRVSDVIIVLSLPPDFSQRAQPSVLSKRGWKREGFLFEVCQRKLLKGILNLESGQIIIHSCPLCFIREPGSNQRKNSVSFGFIWAEMFRLSLILRPCLMLSEPRAPKGKNTANTANTSESVPGGEGHHFYILCIYI